MNRTNQFLTVSLVHRLIRNAILLEKALHYPQLDECGCQQETDLDDSCPFYLALRLLQDHSVDFVPLDMKLLIFAYLFHALDRF